jgi:hypothetical protein
VRARVVRKSAARKGVPVRPRVDPPGRRNGFISNASSTIVELSKLVWQKSLSAIARELGVSDNAVKKHCRVRKISLPGLKHWIEQGNFGFQNRKHENSHFLPV